MRKLIPQLVAILLAPCLIADPSLAAAVSGPTSIVKQSQSEFLAEALEPAAAPFTGIPLSPAASHHFFHDGAEAARTLSIHNGATALSAKTMFPGEAISIAIVEFAIGRSLEKEPVRPDEVATALSNMNGDITSQLRFLGSMMIAPDPVFESMRQTSPYRNVQKIIRERAFRLIERKVSVMSPTNAAEFINSVFNDIGPVDSPLVVSFHAFILQHAEHDPVNEGHRFVSLRFTPNSMYWPVLRGLSLVEFQSIVGNDELVNKTGYGTFSVSNGESTDMVKGDPSVSFQEGREILVRLRVPKWLLAPAGYDYGMVDWDEDQAVIASRHVKGLQARLEKAKTFYETHREEFIHRREAFQKAYRETTRKKTMSPSVWGTFYQDRQNKAVRDSMNDIEHLPGIINSYGRNKLGTLDARYVDWEGSYELNLGRFIREPERWAQDVEPLFREGMGDLSDKAQVNAANQITTPNSLLFRFIAWARALSPEQVLRSRVPSFLLNWARNLMPKQIRRWGLLGAGIESLAIVGYLIPRLLVAEAPSDSSIAATPVLLGIFFVWTLFHTLFLISEHRARNEPLTGKAILRSFFSQLAAFAPYLLLTSSGIPHDAYNGMGTLTLFAVSAHMIYDYHQITNLESDTTIGLYKMSELSEHLGKLFEEATSRGIHKLVIDYPSTFSFRHYSFPMEGQKMYQDAREAQQMYQDAMNFVDRLVQSEIIFPDGTLNLKYILSAGARQQAAILALRHGLSSEAVVTINKWLGVRSENDRVLAAAMVDHITRIELQDSSLPPGSDRSTDGIWYWTQWGSAHRYWLDALSLSVEESARAEELSQAAGSAVDFVIEEGDYQALSTNQKRQLIVFFLGSLDVNALRDRMSDYPKNIRKTQKSDITESRIWQALDTMDIHLEEVTLRLLNQAFLVRNNTLREEGNHPDRFRIGDQSAEARRATDKLRELVEALHFLRQVISKDSNLVNKIQGKRLAGKERPRPPSNSTTPTDGSAGVIGPQPKELGAGSKSDLALGAAAKPLVQLLQGKTRWISHRAMSDAGIAQILGGLETAFVIGLQQIISASSGLGVLGGIVGLGISILTFQLLHINGRYVLDENNNLKIRDTTTEDIHHVGFLQLGLGLGFMALTGVHLDFGTFHWATAPLINPAIALLSVVLLHVGLLNNPALRRSIHRFAMAA